MGSPPALLAPSCPLSSGGHLNHPVPTPAPAPGALRLCLPTSDHPALLGATAPSLTALGPRWTQGAAGASACTGQGHCVSLAQAAPHGGTRQVIELAGAPHPLTLHAGTPLATTAQSSPNAAPTAPYTLGSPQVHPETAQGPTSTVQLMGGIKQRPPTLLCLGKGLAAWPTPPAGPGHGVHGVAGPLDSKPGPASASQG